LLAAVQESGSSQHSADRLGAAMEQARVALEVDAWWDIATRGTGPEDAA
jgi:hypothetical protein